MILKAELERLRAQHPKRNEELHFTIGGPIETQVHATLESERIGKLNRGDRRLAEALEELRRDYAFSSREGLARAHFNGRSPDVEP